MFFSSAWSQNVASGSQGVKSYKKVSNDTVRLRNSVGKEQVVSGKAKNKTGKKMPTPSAVKENKIDSISFVDEAEVLINSIESPTDGLMNYELLDLFSYQQNYYWSCIGECENKNNKFEITDKTKAGKQSVQSFYDYVLDIIKKRKEDKGSQTFRICGPNKVIEQWLCSFTSHRNNKRRISELELYMLQFYLIRHENRILADCEFKDRIKYNIYVN